VGRSWSLHVSLALSLSLSLFLSWPKELQTLI
jgi:hypothetical protein